MKLVAVGVRSGLAPAEEGTEEWGVLSGEVEREKTVEVVPPALLLGGIVEEVAGSATMLPTLKAGRIEVPDRSNHRRLETYPPRRSPAHTSGRCSPI